MKRILLLVLVVLVSTSCGTGGSSPTSPSSSTPQPYNQTVVGTVSSFGTTQHPLTIPRSGTMTLTLTWGTTADLDLYLSTTACTSLYPTASCPILAAADGLNASERITRTVSSGESFKLWIDNLAFSPQNYTIAINIQ